MDKSMQLGSVIVLGCVSNELVKSIIFHPFDEMQISH